jgi:hypothetical protein
MKQDDVSQPREITMRDLYPNLTEEELLQAEQNFIRYLEVAIQMYAYRCGKSRFDGPQFGS